MSEPPKLDVRLTRRVHSRLTIEAALRLASECGVVFGPSGAGKTSLLRAIAGLDRPDSGRVTIGDHTIFDASRRANVPLRGRRIGMIFQDDRLFPHLSVARNIGFGLSAWSRREASSRIEEMAGLCGVAHLLTRDPATLSGGERQRVGLARALAPRPRLLLCDEPVSALDLDARFALIERLRTLQRAEAIPVLYVTHSPAEAVALGSRLFLLDTGRIVDEGEPLDVLARRDCLGDELRNIVPASVAGHDPTTGETFLRLGDGDGPVLIVPHASAPVGQRLAVAIRADDILLALGPIAQLSARNRIAGTVERLIAHGSEREVLVRTGPVVWIVSVVASATAALDLRPGTEVQLIIKARSCRPIAPPPSITSE